MKFTIEIPDQGKCKLYKGKDADNGIVNLEEILQPMSDSDLAAELKKNPNARMEGIVCIKTGSGIVIIGGRPYYIP